MIEQLFGSKTRVKLLQLFYSNPNRSYYVREITRKIDEQINSVRRELANLLSIGIITSDTTNNRLYYEVNQQYEHYPALSAIFGGKKAVTPVAKVAASDNEAQDILQLGNIELALYTGQFTRDDRAEVDLFIVGDINQTKLSKFIADLEAKEGKELRFAVMPLSEYQYRDQVNDRFLLNLKDTKKQILIDRHYLLEKPPKEKEPENKKKKESK